MLTVAGPTSYTERGWAHSWWPAVAEEVARHIDHAGIDLPNHSGDIWDLRGDLPNDPDELPDDTSLGVACDGRSSSRIAPGCRRVQAVHPAHSRR